MRAFLDTNIILYSVLADDLQKADKAILLMATGSCISVQVLNELISVLRGRKKWDWVDVSLVLASTKVVLEVADLTLESHDLAVTYAARYGYTIYDANILASAKLAGCDSLWTEDMQHGQVIDGVEIVNPFL